MAVQQKRDSPGVSPSVIIIGIAILVALIVAGWFLHQRNAAPPPLSPVAVKQRTNLFQAMAQKCHGDFQQLSPADQATVQSATGGNGVMVMKMTAMHYGYH